MIVRKIEVCPKCGKVNPWRKRGSKIVRGQRRIYVKCVRCGVYDTIIYLPKDTNSSPTGN